MKFAHLIEACRGDPHQLAELALLMAMAANAYGVTGAKMPQTRELIRDLNEAVIEIQKRVRS